MYALRVLVDAVQARDQRLLHDIKRAKRAIVELLLAQLLPDMLHRIQFRTMSGLRQ